MRERLLSLDIPRIAVTPIVDGQAIKGPAAKIMAEMMRGMKARMDGWLRIKMERFLSRVEEGSHALKKMRVRFDRSSQQYWQQYHICPGS